MAGDDPGKLIYRAVDSVAAVKDPADRAQIATNAMNALRAASEELRDLRRSAVVDLYEQGWSYQQLGDLMNVGKARAQQLVQDMKASKRPGVIEMETRLAAAEMRAEGKTNEELVDLLVPKIRSYRGGDQVSIAAIAAMLDLPEAWVKKQMPKG